MCREEALLKSEGKLESVETCGLGGFQCIHIMNLLIQTIEVKKLILFLPTTTVCRRQLKALYHKFTTLTHLEVQELLDHHSEPTNTFSDTSGKVNQQLFLE